MPEVASQATGLAPASPLVGRAAELDDVVGLLRATRLLTLTGPGGVGKTSLALAAAQRLALCDGLPGLLVPLAALRRREHVLSSLLDAAGIPERPGLPPLDALVEHLAGRSLLLVLDNCEHLTAVAAEVAERLLRGSSGLRVLATGRRPLEVAGEVTWRTPPLSLPATDTPTAVLDSDAGALFLLRAREHGAEPSLSTETAASIAQVCRELDGLPLAIELVAARTATEPVTSIQAGLRDRLRLLAGGAPDAPPRHRAVRASLEWSQDLLSAQARSALRRLSVLADWSPDSAAAVAALTDAERASLPDVVAALVQAGMVAREGDRYRMPETVRQFAEHELEQTDEAESIRLRHLEYFCALADRADALLEAVDGSEMLTREGANLQAALDFALSRADPRALEIVAGLGLYWLVHDRLSEGRAACARALHAVSERDSRIEALVRWAAAALALHAIEPVEAYAQGEQALAAARRSGDARALGRCLQNMSLIVGTMDPPEGLRMAREAVHRLRGAEDRQGLAHALIALAMAESLCDDLAATRTACAEFESLGANRAHRFLLGWMHVMLSSAAELEGDAAAALAHAQTAVELAGSEPSSTLFMAERSRLLALSRSGHATMARSLGLDALTRATAARVPIAVTLTAPLAQSELALGELESAAARVASLINDRNVGIAGSSLELLAAVELARGDPAAAREHAAALRRNGERAGSGRRQAVADLFDGISALQRDDPGRARELLHRALDRLLERGFRRDAAAAVEALGALAAMNGDPATAARLMGAAAAARRTAGCVRIPADEPWLESLRAHGARQLGSTAWATAWSEGEDLSLDEAAAFAARGRGRRVRSSVGWDSLTRAEAEVAGLAAAGLSNPQIGARLFISRGTVKSHLARVYDKLGVANRTELAGVVRNSGQMADVLSMPRP